METRFGQIAGKVELRDVQCRELEEFRRKCEAYWKKLEEKPMHELDCNEKLKELESNKNKFKADWMKLDERLHEVDQKEKQADGRAESLDLLSKDLARKHQELEKNKRNIETDSKNERICELESRERQLDLRSKDLERQHKELGLDKRKVEAVWNVFDKRIIEVDCRERGLNKGLIDLKREQKELESNQRKFEAYWEKLEERFCEVSHRERQLDARSKDLERQHKELELDKIKIEADWIVFDKRIVEVDCKERGLNKGLIDLKKEQQELESNQRKFEADLKKLDARFCEVSRRERQLDVRSKDLERQHKELELDKIKIEADWKILDKQINEVDCKERGLTMGLIDLKREQKELESNQRKLEADRKKLEEQFCEVSRRETQLDGGLEVLETGNQDLCRQYKELESDKKKFEADRKKLDEQLLEVELNTKKTEEAVKELELKRKDLEEKIREFESDTREFKVDREKLGDRSRCIEDYNFPSEYSPSNLKKVIASVEKPKTELTSDNGVNQCSVYVPSVQITNKACKMVKKSPIVADSNTPQLQQTAAALPAIVDSTSKQPIISTQDPLLKKRKHLDGKSIATKNADSSSKPEETEKDLLGVVLRQNVDFSKVRDKVVEILQSSSNPAITVLNTMKLCRPIEASKEEVPISWCVSLLKELKGVSYAIEHYTIEKAREFSLSWRANMEVKKGDHMEVACFLLFVDAYQLCFTRATFPLISSVRCTKVQLRDYFEQIGMPDFLPDLIKSLIGKNHRIQAVKYLEALNLRDKFPIVPILNDILAYSNNSLDERCNKELNFPDSRKIKAINTRMVAVKSVMKLVKKCNLEGVYPLRPLQEKLTELIRLQRSAGEHKQLTNKELESDTIRSEADRKKLDEQLLEVELKTKNLEEKIIKLESDKREFKVDGERLDDRFKLRQVIASLGKPKAELTEEAVSGDNGVNQCSVYVPSIEITSKACKMVEKSPIVADPNTPQLQQTAGDLPAIVDSTSKQPIISTQDRLPKKRKRLDGKSMATKNADSSSKVSLGVVVRQKVDFSTATATATTTATTTTASSKPPPPPPSSSASSSSAPPPKRTHCGEEQPFNMIGFAPPPPPPPFLPLVRSPQHCPYPWFGGFHPPPTPSYPNQFGPQNGPGGLSNFPSSPYPGFM